MRDAAALLGLCFLASGMGWWIHPGLGLAVAGSLLLSAVVWGYLNAAGKPPGAAADEEPGDEN